MFISFFPSCIALSLYLSHYLARVCAWPLNIPRANYTPWIKNLSPEIKFNQTKGSNTNYRRKSATSSDRNTKKPSSSTATTNTNTNTTTTTSNRNLNNKKPNHQKQGGNRAKNLLKFENDYDFEQANSKFEELRSQLSKLKVGEEAKPEQVSFFVFLIFLFAKPENTTFVSTITKIVIVISMYVNWTNNEIPILVTKAFIVECLWKPTFYFFWTLVPYPWRYGNGI